MKMAPETPPAHEVRPFEPLIASLAEPSTLTGIWSIHITGEEAMKIHADTDPGWRCDIAETEFGRWCGNLKAKAPALDTLVLNPSHRPAAPAAAPVSCLSPFDIAASIADEIRSTDADWGSARYVAILISMSVAFGQISIAVYPGDAEIPAATLRRFSKIAKSRKARLEDAEPWCHGFRSVDLIYRAYGRPLTPANPPRFAA